MEAATPGPEFALSRVRVRLICAAERVERDTLMRAHHYLGLTALVGRSLRYVAEVDGRWLALLGWASPALKCASRDAWIGWWLFSTFIDELSLMPLPRIWER